MYNIEDKDFHNLLYDYVVEMNDRYSTEENEIRFILEFNGDFNIINLHYPNGTACLFDEEVDNIYINMDDDTISEEEYKLFFYQHFKLFMEKNVKLNTMDLKNIYRGIKTHS